MIRIDTDKVLDKIQEVVSRLRNLDNQKDNVNNQNIDAREVNSELLQDAEAAEQEVVPNNQDVVPNNQDVVPNNQDVVPNNQDVVPNSQNVVPNNHHFGFKKTHGNTLVVLQITGKHNESRISNLSQRQFAKMRCSEAVVKSIIDLVNLEEISVAESLHDAKFIYTVNEIVRPRVDGISGEYDDTVNKVCSPGIHYFLNPEAALMYMQNQHSISNWKQWNDDGVFVDSFPRKSLFVQPVPTHQRVDALFSCVFAGVCGYILLQTCF